MSVGYSVSCDSTSEVSLTSRSRERAESGRWVAIVTSRGSRSTVDLEGMLCVKFVEFLEGSAHRARSLGKYYVVYGGWRAERLEVVSSWLYVRRTVTWYEVAYAYAVRNPT